MFHSLILSDQWTRFKRGRSRSIISASLTLLLTLTSSSCTPFKSYLSCEQDRDCPTLTLCDPDGLCVARSESSFPEGISILSGSLDRLEGASVVGLIGRSHTPQWNQNIRDGVMLVEEFIPSDLGWGEREVIWLESRSPSTDSDDLIKRVHTLIDLGVDVLVTSSLTRGELISLQDAIEGNGPSLFILSYEDEQAPPVSVSLPVYAFGGAFVESQEHRLPTTLIQRLVQDANATEHQIQTLLIYDSEEQFKSYQTELSTQLALLEGEQSILPRDRRLSADEQVIAWQALGGLPDEGVEGQTFVIWVGDTEPSEPLSLLNALMEKGYLSTQTKIDLIQIAGTLVESDLESSFGELPPLRRWSLHFSELALLPGSMNLSAQDGSALKLTWTKDEFEEAWFEATESFWMQSAIRFQYVAGAIPLLARSFDLTILLRYVAQFIEEATPFEHHLALSRLLSAPDLDEVDQVKLYPSLAGILSRPNVLDDRLKTSYYGLQGRLYFVSQRVLNPPLPYLSCQVRGGPMILEQLAISTQGQYQISDHVVESCRFLD